MRMTRFQAAQDRLKEYVRAGRFAFSPIANLYPLDLVGTEPPQGWLQWDLQALDHFGTLDVYMLPGWDTSEGVQAEIEIAEVAGLRVVYSQPDQEVVSWLNRAAARYGVNHD